MIDRNNGTTDPSPSRQQTRDRIKQLLSQPVSVTPDPALRPGNTATQPAQQVYDPVRERIQKAMESQQAVAFQEPTDQEGVRTYSDNAFVQGGQRIADFFINFAQGTSAMLPGIAKAPEMLLSQVQEMALWVGAKMEDMDFDEFRKREQEAGNLWIDNLEEMPVYKLATKFENITNQALESAKMDQTPEAKEAFWNAQLPQGFGSMASYIALGYLTRGQSIRMSAPTNAGRVRKLMTGIQNIGKEMIKSPATYVASADAMSRMYQEAKDSGQDEATALTAGRFAAPSGAVQVANVVRLTGRLDRALQGKLSNGMANYLKEGLESGINEYIVEGVGAVLYNAAAQKIWDEDRGLLDNVFEQAQVGGAAGFFSGFLIAALGGRVSGGRLQAPKNPAEQAKINLGKAVSNVESEISDAEIIPDSQETTSQNPTNQLAKPVKVEKTDIQPGDIVTYDLDGQVLSGTVANKEDTKLTIELEDGSSSDIWTDDVVTATRQEAQQEAVVDAIQLEANTTESTEQPKELTYKQGKKDVSLKFIPNEQGTLSTERTYNAEGTAKAAVTSLGKKYPGIKFEVNDLRDKADPFSEANYGIEATIKGPEELSGSKTSPRTVAPKAKPDARSIDPITKRVNDMKSPEIIAEAKRLEIDYEADGIYGEDLKNEIISRLKAEKDAVDEAENVERAKRREKAEEERKKREETAMSGGLSAGKYNPEFQSKPKALGREEQYMPADGSEMRNSQFVVVEATDVLPSHDPFTFEKTPGYPQYEDGTSANDNDYTRPEVYQPVIDKEKNLKPALLFQDLPIIGPDGIVISGNNRTMSLLRAIKDSPDRFADYLEQLKQRAGQYGINASDLDGFTNPILYRMDKDVKVYNKPELARHNAVKEKQKSPLQQAINLVKTMPESAAKRFADIVETSEAGTIREALDNPATAKEFADFMVGNGIVNANQLTQYYDQNSRAFNDAGKSLVENIARASILNEKALEVAQRDGLKQFASVFDKAIPTLLKIRKLGDDYDLSSNMNQAFLAKEEQVRKGLSDAEFYGQQDAFDGLKFDAGLFHYLINNSTTSNNTFKLALDIYHRGAEAGGGLFETEPKTRDQLTSEIYEYLIGKSKEAISQLEQLPKSKDNDAKLQEAKRRLAQVQTVASLQRSGQEVRRKPEQPAERESTESGRDDSTEQPTPKQEEVDPTKPKDNTIFTQDSYEEALKRMKDRLGKTNMGIDPMMFVDGITISGYHIEKGVRTFAAYSKVMIDALGDGVKPYLKSWYEGVKRDPEVVKAGYHKEMTPTAEVDAFDFDSATTDSKRASEAIEQAQSEGQRESFIKEVIKAIDEGNQLSKSQLDKLANTYGITGDKAIKELAELAVIQKAREIATDVHDNEIAFNKIVQLYENQPNLNARTSTSILNQQYSTPVPLAYLMGRFVNLHLGVTAFEPSAGNGLLTVASGKDTSNITVNEIDADRLDSLRMQEFADVMSRDGSKPFDEFKKAYEAVITNPPFGTTDERYPFTIEGRTGELSKLEHVMSAIALDTMAYDGKAAIIIGGHDMVDSQGRRKGQDGQFFNYLYHNYNVKDVINIDGGLFAKQGTRFPTRVILVDGRKSKPSGFAPLLSGVESVKTFKQYYDRVLNAYIKANSNENIQQTRVDSDLQPSGDTAGPGTTTSTKQDSQPGGLSSVPQGRTDSTIETGAKPKQGDSGLSSTDGNTGVSSDGTKRAGRPATATGSLFDSLDGTTTTDRDATAQGKQKSEDQRQRNERDPRREESSVVTRVSAEQVVDNQGGNIDYIPVSKAESIQTEVPASMAMSMSDALEALVEQVGNIDSFVMNQAGFESMDAMYEALSSEQIDAIAMAIHQAQRGKALIVGDQTGIGKGRVAATMIKYARKQGLTPVFFTEKNNLFSDIHRDLTDIGDNFRPFIVNSDTDVMDQDGRVVYSSLKGATHDKVLKDPTKLSAFDYVGITYSQIASESYVKKREFVSRIAPNALFILDEAHNASGSSNTGAFIREILEQSKGATYLSATFAKRPDNFPVYAVKTDISNAAMSMEEMIEAITRGGVALQEILSADLVRSGQMVRRQRSFKGVKRDFKAIGYEKDGKLNKEGAKQRALYDQVSNIMRDIIDFQNDHVKPIIADMDKDVKDAAKTVGMTTGTQSAGVDNQPFVSRIHNIVDQLLFSIKVDAVADEAIAVLKSDRKPVIAVKSTMEAIINDTFEMNENIDNLSFGRVMERALLSVMKYTTKDGISRESKTSQLTREDLGEYARQEYDRIIEMSREITDELSPSPIDRLVSRIEEAGFSIGEVTGRGKKVVLNPDGTGIVRQRSKAESDKNTLYRKFNNGETDALIINAAGATGASAHSSSKFKDQRQRVMIIHQPELNINTEVQKWGRIFRTGQVNLPEYRYVTTAIPAETRLMMILKKKIKSLDANTTSSQKTSSDFLEMEDFINKYGDYVVSQYLMRNKDLNKEMQYPIGVDSIVGLESGTLEKVEDIAQKATGRIALLDSETQERFYQEISEQYASYIDMLNQYGENELAITNIDLQAKTLKKTTIVVGSDEKSPFGQSTYLEEVLAKVLKKPMKKADIDKQVEVFLEGKSAKQSVNDLADEANNYINQWLDAEIESIQNRKYSDRFDQAERIETLTESAKEKARQWQYLLVDKVIKQFVPGEMYVIPADSRGMSGDKKNAIFLGFNINRNAKNIFTLSNVKLRFATNDTQRLVTVPASSNGFINSALADSNYFSETFRTNYINNWDSKIVTSDTEKRYIATGNILQAINRLDGKGQLISYTTSSGGIKTGVIVPKNITDKEMQGLLKVKVPASNAAESIKNLYPGRPFPLSDGVSFVFDYRDGLRLSVPASKARGGKFYLDGDLLKLLGDFYKRGNSMVVKVPEAKIQKTLDILTKNHQLYANLDTDGAGVNESTTAYSGLKSDNEVSYTNGKIEIKYSPETEEIHFGPEGTAKKNREFIVREARKSVFRGQLSLFDQQPVNHSNRAADRIQVFEGHDQYIYKRAVIDDFETYGHVNLIGRKLKSPQDLIDLYAIHRSPLVEKMHFIVTNKNGKIVASTSVTSNSSSYVMFDKEKHLRHTLITGARAGGVNLWISHNHPSGTMVASSADINLTRAIGKILDSTNQPIKLAGHVVMDTDAFVFIDSTGETEVIGLDVPLKDFYKKDRALAKLIDPDTAGEYTKRIFDPNHIAVAYMSTYMQIMGYDLFPAGTTISTINEKVKEQSKHMPTTSVFVISEQSSLESLGLDKEVFDFIVNDVFLVNGRVTESVFSSRDNKLNYFNRRQSAKNSDIRSMPPKMGHLIREPEVLYQTPDDAARVLQFSPDIETARARIQALYEPTTSSSAIAQEVRSKIESWAQKSNIKVAETMADIPAELRMMIAKQRKLPYGVYYNGTSYLLSFAHPNVDSAWTTILHEAVGHGGIRKLIEMQSKNQAEFTKEFNSLLDEVFNQYKGDRRFLDLAKLYGSDLNTIDGQRLASEEFIAHLAESSENRTLLQKVAQFIRKLLREMGIDLKLSDNDIFNMIADARQIMEGSTAQNESTPVELSLLTNRGIALYHFVGENAQLSNTIRDNLVVAHQMENEGFSTQPNGDTRTATGWFKNPYDGKWRYEIDDPGIKPDYWDSYYNRIKTRIPYNTTLSDLLSDDSQLLKLYPQLADVKIVIGTISENILTGGQKGFFDVNRNLISINYYSQLKYGGKQGISTLVHEIQHAVQEIEGFAVGGSPQMFMQDYSNLSDAIDEYNGKLKQLVQDHEKGLIPKDKFNDLYHDTMTHKLGYVRELQALRDPITGTIGYPQYKRLAGEIEAREVQNRIELTESERKGRDIVFENVSKDEAIVLFDDDKMTSVEEHGEVRFHLDPTDVSIADYGNDNRVPGGFRRIASLKGMFMEPLVWLEEKPTLKPVADAVRNHFDRWAQRGGLLYGKAHKEILKPLSRLKKHERVVVLQQYYDFMRLRETGNNVDADAMRPGMHDLAVKMLDYTDYIATYAGDINEALNVQVFDPKINDWRNIGRVAEFFPRKLNRTTEATLRNPHKYSEHWNELVEALIDEGFVENRAEADKYLKTYIQDVSINNYFAGVEKARSKALPSMAYDYRFEVVMDYVGRWSERISQIEFFGQVTTPDTKDLFDQYIQTVADENTRNFIGALRDRVYNKNSKDGFHQTIAFLNKAASGLQLGNFGTATLNLIGGTSLNFMAYPTTANLKALGHLLKPTFNFDISGKTVKQALAEMIELKNLADMIQEGRDRGAITNDMIMLLRDTDNVEGFLRTPELLQKLGVPETIGVNDLMNRFVEFTMKYGGYTPTEMFIRSHAQLTAKYTLIEANRNIAKNPVSRESLKAIRFMQEHGFDYRRLLAENGKGSYTERYIRYMSNLTQGSYKVDQTPIHLDTPIGRFFFKYVKFISQVSRMWYKNNYKPFMDSITKGGSAVRVEVDGVMTTQRVKEFAGMMKFFAASAIGGELVRSLRHILFGYQFTGPGIEELEKALEDDDRMRALGLIFDRTFWNIQATGGLTILGNYWQLTQGVFDRERSRNPLDPPGLGLVKNTGYLALDLYDQNGKLTARQLDNYIEQQFSLYRTAKRPPLRIMHHTGVDPIGEAAQYQAKLDRNYVRGLIRRYEQTQGITGSQTIAGRTGKGPNSIMNERIHEALAVGEPGRAVSIFLREVEKRPGQVANMAQSVNTSMRHRRPVGNRSEDAVNAFYDWLDNQVTEDAATKARRIQNDYQNSLDTMMAAIKGIRSKLDDIDNEIERLKGLEQTEPVKAEITRLTQQRKEILRDDPSNFLTTNR